MNNDINPESLAASVATELAKDALKSVAARLSKTTRDLFDLAFPRFEDHLSRMYERNSCVKILTSKEVPVSFEEIYVKSDFVLGSEEYSDADIRNFIGENKRAIISANGGAGKTFLMRFLWMEFFREKVRIPVFVELRNLNKLSSVDLASFIRGSAFGAEEFSSVAFDKFCQKGVFVFILDGFDEVEREKRKDLEEKIIDLAKKYRDCGFVVSGRPDDRFDGWQSFSSFKAKPFDYSKFRLLIEKVPFEEDSKKSFLGIATKDFFGKHESFLSNPLLALMMLMTYRDNAEIPTKLNTFYENCFSTLYSQHDALKESFSRKKNLDQDTFRKVFSVFCLFSYIENRFALEEADYRVVIDKARKFLGVDVSVDDISDDFLESVNLLIKEGTTYTFIHRSFQEYFSAYCVTSVIVEKTAEMVDLFARRRQDNTFLFAYEIHAGLVLKRYLLPLYEDLKGEGRLPKNKSQKLPYLALSKSGFKVTFAYRKLGKTDRVGEPGKETVLYSFSWGWDKEYERFIFPAAKCLIDHDSDSKIDSAVFESMHKIFMTLADDRNPSSDEYTNIPSVVDGTNFEVRVTFNSNAPVVEITFSKDYSRNPRGTVPFLERVESLLPEFARGIEDSLISTVRELSLRLDEVKEIACDQKNTIEDFFKID